MGITMKIGDLIKWTSYKEKQYVPVVEKKIGVIAGFKFNGNRNIVKSVMITCLSGERVTIEKESFDYQSIEVISENR